MRLPARLFASLFPMLLSALAIGQPMFETVERRSFQETVHLDGIIEAAQQSTVSAQTSGTVQSLPYDVDASVAAGDLIVQLEDSEQRSRLRQAQAGLEETEAALADARQRFERIEAVHERGLVSRQEFDQARNNLAAARARAERAQGAVSEAREQLSYTRVVAPYGGILTERHVEVGGVGKPRPAPAERTLPGAASGCGGPATKVRRTGARRAPGKGHACRWPGAGNR